MKDYQKYIDALKHTNKPTKKIDESNFDQDQYEADLQCAYDCGYNKAMSVIDEIINKHMKEGE